MIYWGVTSWNKDGDIVYNHHQCFRGPMLPFLPNGVVDVVLMLTLQLLAFMTPDSRVVETLG